MKRVVIGVFACALALAATPSFAQDKAQDKPPLKLGGILDMSSLYADITGVGSETAAKMAVEDFGGEVLGRKIEIVTADHLNKADLSANIARDMFDNQGVEMLFDVAASATALAAGEKPALPELRRDLLLQRLALIGLPLQIGDGCGERVDGEMRAIERHGDGGDAEQYGEEREPGEGDTG